MPEFIEGTITRTRVAQSGNEESLYAVVQTVGGERVALRMTGHEVRGVVERGDHVKFERAAPSSDDGTLVITRLENLSTGTTVAVWSRPLRRRVARLGIPIVVAPTTGAVIAFVLNNAKGRTDEAVGGLLTVAIVVATLLVVTVVGALGVYLLYLRPQARRREVPTASATRDETAAGSDVPERYPSDVRLDFLRGRLLIAVNVAIVTLSVLLSVSAAYFAALTLQSL